MSKAYLIHFESQPNEDGSNFQLDREEMAKYFVSKGVIETWQYCLPFSIIVKSNSTSKVLSEIFKEKYGEHFSHIIVGIDDYWGILPKGYWNLIEE